MHAITSTRHHRVRTRERFIVAGFVGDVIVVTLALWLAYVVRFESPLVTIGVVHLDMSPADYLPHVVLGVALMMVLLSHFRLYAPAYIHALRRHWRIIGQACVVWVLAYLTLSLIFKVSPPISRLYCALAGAFSLASLMTWRKFFNVALSRETISRRINLKVLFIGWSEESRRLARAIENEPNHIYEIVGIIPRHGFSSELIPPQHIPRLGNYGDIESVLGRHEVDLVLLTDMGIAKDDLVRIAIACEKELVEFKLIPNVFQILVSGLHLENLGGIPLLGISKLPLHSAFNSHFKRLVDIVGGATGLILTAPLIAIFGALIKLEDGGPVFYRQTRLGRNGQLFSICKLRSMRLDAEGGGRAGWTVADDPRCLRIGRFIRRWNLDETPQFWNVLRGEMSLVGPRPERPELISRFKNEIVHYNARHNIKPGITGWAQVNGLRGDTDLSERVKFDLYYIENWNPWLDFQIMAMTFFKRQGAC
jgi:exopolysaccharide biosynthesis polyprenyl glycosylphosphotransferase